MNKTSPLTSFQNYGFYFLQQHLDKSLSIFLKVYEHCYPEYIFVENMSTASIIFPITYKILTLHS